MALPKMQLVGENKRITPQNIEQSIGMLEDKQQQDFIR